MEFFKHMTLGFCWWDIPVLLLLVAATVWFFVRRHQLKKEKEQLQASR